MYRSRSKPMSAFDLVEAFHLSHAAFALHDLGIGTSLKHPSTVPALARKHNVNPKLLSAILEYVGLRTSLVTKDGERFVATEEWSDKSGFILDLYHGAFGLGARHLCELLRNRPGINCPVDRELHARAFSQIEGVGAGWEEDVIRRLRLNNILDLGCGSGVLLIQLALHNPRLVGWGLEMNPAMIRSAKAQVRKAGLAKAPSNVSGRSDEIDAGHAAKHSIEYRGGRCPPDRQRIFREWNRTSRKVATAPSASVSGEADAYLGLLWKTWKRGRTIPARDATS